MEASFMTADGMSSFFPMMMNDDRSVLPGPVSAVIERTARSPLLSMRGRGILNNVPSMLLSRNLLYTAVTRAQSMVVLVGRTEAVQAMVANHRPSMRYTGLCYRLRERNG